MAPANRPPRGGSRRRGRTRRRPPADYGAYGSVSKDADKDAPRFEPRRTESPRAEYPRDDSFSETAPPRDSEGRGSGRRRRGSSRGGDSRREPERPQPDVTGAFDTEREGPGVAPVDPKGFAKFNLRHELTQALGVMGFEGPRPIQEKALPAGLAGRDVLGLAQTGTGKTAAFVLPILQRLLVDRHPGLRALVVVPTRELATQVHQEFERLGQFTPLSSTAIFGGVPIGRHQRALKARPDVVVACPGRLLDLHNQGMIRMNNVEVLVLDEADHMFDMGFLPDLRRILRTLPPRRQNLMFSATMAKEIRKLADDVLRKPEVVELANTRPAETIDHALYRIAEGEKLDALEDLLSTDDFRSAIVFTRTKHRAKRIAQKLANRGLAAIALQGNMSQAQRERAMKGFRGDTYNVMVATDIAARGLDIEGVSHVVNYDVPVTPDAYTHRIGRTGRSEQVGSAFTFVTPADGLLVKQIEKRLGHAIDRRKIRDVASPIDRSDRPEEEPIENRPPRGGGRGGGFGSRRGGGRGGARGGSRRGGGRGGPRGGGRPGGGGGGARPAAAPRQDAAPERKERPSGPGFGAGLAGEAGGPRRTRRRRR